MAASTNENYAKLGHRGFGEFWDLAHISGTAKAREFSCTISACSPLNAASAKFLWPLVYHLKLTKNTGTMTL